MAEYQLWLSTPTGVRQAVIESVSIISLQYTLVANTFGTLIVTLPASALTPSMKVEADSRLEVFRDAGRGFEREGRTFWLVVKETIEYKTTGEKIVQLEAKSASSILARRIVKAYAETARSSKSGAADDLMKEVVAENLGVSADSGEISSSVTRGLGSGLTMMPDHSVGATVEKQFAYQNVLSVLQDLAKQSIEDGTDLYFDLYYDGSGLVFDTFSGQLGIDRTSGANLLVVSPERGSFGGTIQRVRNWADTATHVTAGGQGQTTARVLAQVSNSDLISASTYGLREAFVDANQASTVEGVLAEAIKELQDRRPKKILTGSLISIPGAAYGLDWGWGDKIKVEFENETWTAWVDLVSVKLAIGIETVEAKLVAEQV